MPKEDNISLSVSHASRVFDFAVKVCTIAGPFVVAFTVMWLDRNYVSRAEFSDSMSSSHAELTHLTQQVSDIERAILILTEQQKINSRQDARLDEAEKRIRCIELDVAKLGDR